jgi:hypothetical protein
MGSRLISTVLFPGMQRNAMQCNAGGSVYLRCIDVFRCGQQDHSRQAAGQVRKTRRFLACETPSLCQDRLGTNVRKVRREMWLDSTLPPGLIAQPDGTPIMEADKVPDDFMILPTGVCHIEFAHSVCVCPEPVLANDRILFPKREGKPEGKEHSRCVWSG